MKKTPEQEIRDALADTGMVVPINSSGRGGKVEFLCRIVPGQDAAWLEKVETLLSKVQNIFIARQYLLKDGKMVFGWYIEVDSGSAGALKETVPSFIAALQRAVITKEGARPALAIQPKRPSPVKVVSRFVDNDGNLNEITEMPIPHVRTDLNTPTKPVWSAEHGRYIGGGKGASGLNGGR